MTSDLEVYYFLLSLIPAKTELPIKVRDLRILKYGREYISKQFDTPQTLNNCTCKFINFLT